MNFTLLKVPVIVHPSFWVFLLLVAMGSNCATAEMFILLGVFSFGLLFHEYGHALVALSFGKRPEISLIAFGGYTSYENRGLTDKQHFFIVLGGPFFTAILIVSTYYLLKMDLSNNPYLDYFLYNFFKLNILWLCVNLIPLFPLDGGQILRYLLQAQLGKEKGLKASLIIGNICAITACIYFFSFGHYFFGSLFLFNGFQNLQAYYQSGFARRQPNNLSLLNDGIRFMENNEMENSKRIFKKLMKSTDNYFKIASIESLATIFDKEGNHSEAYKIISKVDPESLKKGKWLLCRLAYEQGNYSLIEKYANEIYEINPSYETAILNSKAYACLKKPEYSGGWLHTASLFENVSKKQLQEIIHQNIYDHIRGEDAFQQCIQSSTTP